MTTQYKFEIVLLTSDDEIAGEFCESTFRDFVSRSIVEGITCDEIEGIGSFVVTRTSKTTDDENPQGHA
jgi:hypothetical protein